MMYQLRVYTREATEHYPDGLAYSIHMSLRAPEGSELPLNRNYGLLFASALIDEHDRICPRFLSDPWISPMDDGWMIGASVDGEYDRWFTGDFCHFKPLGMSGDRPSGTDSIEINDEIAQRLIHYWNDTIGAPFSIDPRVPEGLSYPLACGYGDPVILKWQGMYYYIATNDKTDNIGLYIRKSDTLPGLFSAE